MLRCCSLPPEEFRELSRRKVLPSEASEFWTMPVFVDGLIYVRNSVGDLCCLDDRTAAGEAVFGEIGGRPPGAHQVDQMNYACDMDVFREWANAVCKGRIETEITRKYNVATIYKRARGSGVIQRIEGREAILAKYRPHIVCDTLLGVGQRRRNWRHTLVSDGFIMLRHPDLQTTLAMADEVGANLNPYAE